MEVIGTEVQARNALVEEHLALPAAVIRSIIHLDTVRRLGFDDAYSVGCLAMIRLAEHYDPMQGQPFRTWAYRSIRSAILRASRRDTYCMVIPEKVWFDYRKSLRLTYDTVGRVAETPSQRGAILCRQAQVVDVHELREYIPDHRWKAPEVLADLEDKLPLLPSREADVLQRCFYEGKTLRQIGTEMGISHQMVGLIKNRALKRLALLLEVDAT